MFKEIAQKTFCFIFLFIFVSKMGISLAPMFFANMDDQSVYSVIMQLEIENHSSKECEIKDAPLKGEYLHSLNQYTFSQPLTAIDRLKLFCAEHSHVQSFHPRVPTPPPNV